jgi:hypothetical protein
METNSDKRKKQSGVNHYRWGILRTSLLMTFLLGTLLIMAVKVAASDEVSGWAWQQLAQETEGYWQLVDTIVDPVPQERISTDNLGTPDMRHAYAEEVRSGVLCKTVTNSLSDGSYTLNIKVNQGEKCYKNSGSFSAVATWGRPPERIIPGTPLTLEANLSKSMQGPHGAYVSFGITTDEPDVGCGYLTAGAKDSVY